ncbi:MAG: TonB-dependent receptor, partial [Novosphingobium sp.]
FDLNWQMTPQFSLTAVYALTDTKITKDTRQTLLGSALSNVPKHSGALYGYWQSNGSEAGSVSIGGGLTYVGNRPGDDANSGFRLPDYVTARVNLGWQVSKAVSVHLDADNLFDAYYLESSYSDVWITPGAPRTIKGRIKLAI